MPNLRDLIRGKNLYEGSVEQIISLLEEPNTEVEPEDVIDYTLNIGHRHRIVEGWDVVAGLRFDNRRFEQIHYPERAFWDALAKRTIDEELDGTYNFRDRYREALRFLLSNAFSLASRRDLEIDRSEIYSFLDASVYYERTASLAQRFRGYMELEERASSLSVDLAQQLRGDLEQVLSQRRIMFPEIGISREENLLTLCHFITCRTIGGFKHALNGSKIFRLHFSEDFDKFVEEGLEAIDKREEDGRYIVRGKERYDLVEHLINVLGHYSRGYLYEQLWNRLEQEITPEGRSDEWCGEYLNNFHCRLPIGIYRTVIEKAGRMDELPYEPHFGLSKKRSKQTNREFFDTIDGAMRGLRYNPEDFIEVRRIGQEQKEWSQFGKMIVSIYLKMREGGYTKGDLTT